MEDSTDNDITVKTPLPPSFPLTTRSWLSYTATPREGKTKQRMSYNVVKEGILKQKKKFQRRIAFNLLESTQCGICHEFLAVPMMISCGHNYCYECLRNWFSSNSTRELNCPNCRVSVIDEPRLNLVLEQLIDTVLQLVWKKRKKMFKGNKGVLRELGVLKKERFDAGFKYRKEKESGSLFDGLFTNSAIAIQDSGDEDGIMRCSNCHWELEPDDMEEANVCPHCHFRIRNSTVKRDSRGDILHDEVDREAYSEGEYERICEEIQKYSSSDLEEDSDTGSVEEQRREDEEEEMDSDLASFIADDDEEVDEASTSGGEIGDGGRRGASPDEEDRSNDLHVNNMEEHSSTHTVETNESDFDLDDEDILKLDKQKSTSPKPNIDPSSDLDDERSLKRPRRTTSVILSDEE